MSRKPRRAENGNNVTGNEADGNDIVGADGVDGIILGQPVTAVDPTTAVGDSDANSGSDSDRTPTGRIKRKYSKRSGGNSSQETVRVDIFQQLLFSTHLMLSMALKTPELALQEEEAKAVADAYAGVAEYYPVLRQSEKAVAITNLVATVGMVYGTRAVLLWRKSREPKEEVQNIPGQFPHNIRNAA